MGPNLKILKVKDGIWTVPSNSSLLPVLGGRMYGSDFEFRIFFYIIPCVPCLSKFLLCFLLSFVSILLFLSKVVHDGVQHGNDTGTQVTIARTSQFPGHFWRRGIFLAERGWILALVEAFHDGFRLLHYFQGETPISCRGLVGILFLATNL